MLTLVELAVLLCELDNLSRLRRFVDRSDHFDAATALVTIDRRWPFFINGGDEILEHHGMAVMVDR